MNAATPQTILVVDDDPHLLATLRDMLVHAGYAVLTARTGEEALAVMTPQPPDLIILDISMPGMGGTGFLRHIAMADGKPAYPVVVLTARANMREFFGTLDVAAFLPKPCEREQLLQAIRQHVRRRTVARPPPRQGPLRVLLAEDDPHLCENFAFALRKAGCEVHTVDNGPAVLEQAMMLRPEVIAMRDVLPRMNGRVVAPALAKMTSTKDIPIVLYGSEETAEDLAQHPKYALRSSGLRPARPPEDVTRYIPAITTDELVRAVLSLAPKRPG
jgi:CheY-like chemotaxis protein